RRADAPAPSARGRARASRDTRDPASDPASATTPAIARDPARDHRAAAPPPVRPRSRRGRPRARPAPRAFDRRPTAWTARRGSRRARGDDLRGWPSSREPRSRVRAWPARRARLFARESEHLREVLREDALPFVDGAVGFDDAPDEAHDLLALLLREAIP